MISKKAMIKIIQKETMNEAIRIVETEFESLVKILGGDLNAYLNKFKDELLNKMKKVS